MSRKKDNLTRSFFEEPTREFGVREFARLHKIAPATASKELSVLCDQNLIVKRKERNVLLFKAKEDSQEYKDAKRAYSIQKIRASGILTYLDGALGIPIAVFLFGSYAKAENRPGSDIDLFVMTRTKRQIDVSAFEKKLKAPIQLFVHTPEEIDTLKTKNPHLLNNMINGVKLAGFWEAF